MAYLKTVKISRRAWHDLEPELLVLGLFQEQNLSPFHRDVDARSGGVLSDRLAAGDFSGKLNETLMVYSTGPARRILMVGMGKQEEFTLDRLRQVAGTAAKTAQAGRITQVVTEIPGRETLKETLETVSRAFVEGMILGSYKFLDYKSDQEEETVLQSVVLIHPVSRKGVHRAVTVSEAVCFVRDLAAHPSNVVTPTRLASEARRIARVPGMKCTVFGRQQFVKMGMEAFGAVARGTDEPPKFVLLHYTGRPGAETSVAFVGKGITFDTGGISIKRSKSMHEMKFDMCGAAAVLGVMKAVGQLKPEMNIVGAMACTENMPGGHATKPGDIVRAYNGKTIEILNTDAEGRLILADALSYVAKNFNPRWMVNFATLTGAVVVALGHWASAVMGSDETLIQEIMKAGELSGERVWHLPLWDEYSEDIKGKVADVKNIGSPGQAGTIAGGAFLKEFVGDISWAHIDIAGTAWWDKDRPYAPSGPSGVGVRLGLELLNLLSRAGG
ncbi:MAG: leucyl aminopeptidase [Fidelibacterota bacterium]